jgi:hypothetical protein
MCEHVQWCSDRVCDTTNPVHGVSR